MRRTLQTLGPTSAIDNDANRWKLRSLLIKLGVKSAGKDTFGFLRNTIYKNNSVQ